MQAGSAVPLGQHHDRDPQPDGLSVDEGDVILGRRQLNWPCDCAVGTSQRPSRGCPQVCTV